MTQPPPDHASAPALRQLRRAQSTPAGWRIAVRALINA